MSTVLDVINREIVEIFDSVIRAEGICITKEKEVKLSMSEVHTISVIGVSELKSMSEIAEKLKITVGTLTVAINNLVKKGYVERFKSEKDRRIVKVGLTKQGKLVYYIHEKFHADLVTALTDGLSEREIDTVSTALSKLDKFVTECYSMK